MCLLVEVDTGCHDDLMSEALICSNKQRSYSEKGEVGGRGRGKGRGGGGAGLWGCVGQSRSCPHWLVLQLRGERDILGDSTV